MTSTLEILANLDERRLFEAMTAVREQSSWCPKVAEIPHYELQTLLSIAIRTYWKAQTGNIVSPLTKQQQHRPNRTKGPAKMDPKRTLVLRRDNYVCYLCAKPIGKGQDSIDHVIPKAKGGTNGISNLRAAHKECNYLKGNMLLEEFRMLYPHYPVVLVPPSPELVAA